MIKNPKYGWCDFELGEFKGHPSYLTNVPIDLLNAFINYYIDGYGMAWFDEEADGQFTFVITPFYTYIIKKDVELILYENDISIDELAKELIDDIENSLTAWSIEFCICNDHEELTQNRIDIRQKLAKLKKMMTT